MRQVGFWLCVIVLAACSGQKKDSKTPASGLDHGDMPPLVDRQDYFADPEIASAQLSPDGAYVAFRQPYRGKMNVWVKEIGAPFDDARPLTADTERSIPGYFWSRDSEWILFIQDDGGDENYRVHAVDPAGESAEDGVPEARDLTPLDDVRAQFISVPDSTPGEILIGLNDRDPQVHDVYRLDLETGERELVIENTDSVVGWLADNHGKVRVATRQNAEGGTDIYWVKDGELEDEPFYGCSALESCGAVAFHEDSERVYMITNRGDDVNLSRLTLFDPESGEMTLVEEDPEGKVDFGGPVFNEDDQLIGTSYVYHEGARFYPMDEQFERDLEFLRGELPEGDLSFGSSTKDETKQIVSVQSDVNPGETYLYDRENETVEKLYEIRPELDPEQLAPMQAITYEARDGLEIPAYLTLPRGVEPQSLPVIVFPHGGPWHRDTWGYSGSAQFLANRGYAVLQPNFRGSTGYGKEFLNAGNKQWGDAMQDDITDGVNYLIEEGIADPERVGIYGGSYGGYATLAGLTFTPDVYAAGVSVVGPSSILTLLESVPPYWKPIIKIFHTRLGDPDDPEDYERMKRQSPLFSADEIEAPLMVVQGANDPRVIQRESDQIVVAARENGVDVKYLVAEDEGHGFRNEDNRLGYIAAMEEFFADHLGGRHQPDMSEEAAEALARMRTDVDAVKVAEGSEDDGERAEPTLPEVEVSALEPVTLFYDVAIEAQGREMEASATRRIEENAQDGEAAWKVTERLESGAMGRGSQSYWLDASSLRTLRQEGSGQMDVELTYAIDAIRGSVTAMGQDHAIEESLDEPVLGSGSADNDVVFAALPLDEGFETAYRTYDLQGQETQTFDLAVTGTEDLEVAAGSFETYVVEVKARGADLEQTLYLKKDAPHHVVRSELSLPPEMGGVEVSMELKGRE